MMNRFATIVLTLATVVVFIGASRAPAQVEDANGQGNTQFMAIDIVLDTDQQLLGAYQFELTLDGPEAQIVGLEGGESDAFDKAPFYDANALAGGRIVVAAYSLGPDLPAGRSRVARVHVMTTDPERTEYRVRLITGADEQGQPLRGATIVAEPAGDAS